MQRSSFFVLLFCTALCAAQVQLESVMQSQERSCCDGCPTTCPPLWLRNRRYELSELVSDVRFEAFACLDPEACGTVTPGGDPAAAGEVDWTVVWARHGRCTPLCPTKAWVVGATYPAGSRVYYDGHSYRCTSSTGNICGNIAYQPGVGPYWWLRWVDEGECQQQLCRGRKFQRRGPYNAGEVVQSGGELYQCINPPNCNDASGVYDPPTGSSWTKAWRNLGLCRSPCDGCKVCLPTCPSNVWSPNAVYAAGSLVYNPTTGDYYQCYNPTLCNQGAYNPGMGQSWPAAWLDLGKCQHRCPLIRWTLNTNYALNIRVYHAGHSFRCRAAHVSSMSSEPSVGPTSAAFWIDEGRCQRPECPNRLWAAKDTFVLGDRVEAADTQYLCRNPEFCSRDESFAPPSGQGWQRGWVDWGPCRQPCCKESCLPTCPARVWARGETVPIDTVVVHAGVQYRCALRACSGEVQPGVSADWFRTWWWVGPCKHRCPVATSTGAAITWVVNGNYGPPNQFVYDPVTGHSYACFNPGACGLLAFQPGVGPQWPSAWTDLGECQLRRCPRRAYRPAQGYSLGEGVLVGTDDVYECYDLTKCSSADTSYSPPNGAQWTLAWRYRGKCKPQCGCEKDCPVTCPTTRPWVSGTSYPVGALVYNPANGHTYRCYDPTNCGNAAYSPGATPASNWPLAWYDEGPCRLPCAKPWNSNTQYASGNIVFTPSTGHNYQCLASPCPSGFAYQPGVGPLAWLVWKDLGECSLMRCPNVGWVSSAQYYVGAQVVFGGQAYRCNDASRCGQCAPVSICTAPHPWTLVGPCSRGCDPARPTVVLATGNMATAARATPPMLSAEGKAMPPVEDESKHVPPYFSTMAHGVKAVPVEAAARAFPPRDAGEHAAARGTPPIPYDVDAQAVPTGVAAVEELEVSAEVLAARAMPPDFAAARSVPPRGAEAQAVPTGVAAVEELEVSAEVLAARAMSTEEGLARAVPPRGAEAQAVPTGMAARAVPPREADAQAVPTGVAAVEELEVSAEVLAARAMPPDFAAAHSVPPRGAEAQAVPTGAAAKTQPPEDEVAPPNLAATKARTSPPVEDDALAADADLAEFAGTDFETEEAQQQLTALNTNAISTAEYETATEEVKTAGARRGQTRSRQGETMEVKQPEAAMAPVSLPPPGSGPAAFLTPQIAGVAIAVAGALFAVVVMQGVALQRRRRPQCDFDVRYDREQSVLDLPSSIVPAIRVEQLSLV